VSDTWDGSPPKKPDNIPAISLNDFLELKDEVMKIARKISELGVPVASRVRYETLGKAARYIALLEDVALAARPFANKANNLRDALAALDQAKGGEGWVTRENAPSASR